MSSTSKTAAKRALPINGRHLANEGLCVIAAFGSANL
jgi:hypothetical protein